VKVSTHCTAVERRIERNAIRPVATARKKDIAWFFRKLRLRRMPHTSFSATSKGKKTPELVKKSINTEMS
jgi:alpha-amylase/alpha-mannosidase (GH57 family)